MTPGALVGVVTDEGKGPYPYFWCIACEEAHGGLPGWTWDGNQEAPSISPSYRVNYGDRKPECHVTVTAGKLQYHGDSKHALAGQLIAMEPIPF